MPELRAGAAPGAAAHSVSSTADVSACPLHPWPWLSSPRVNAGVRIPKNAGVKLSRNGSEEKEAPERWPSQGDSAHKGCAAQRACRIRLSQREVGYCRHRIPPQQGRYGRQQIHRRKNTQHNEICLEAAKAEGTQFDTRDCRKRKEVANFRKMAPALPKQ